MTAITSILEIKPLSEYEPEPLTGVWGHWVWDAKLQTLDYCKGPEQCARYFINMNEIQTHRDIVHWLWHIGRKGWMSVEDRSNLLIAFYDLFGCGVAHVNGLLKVQTQWFAVRTFRYGIVD